MGMTEKGERIREGMQRAREQGKYICRPAKFMFTDDLDEAHPEKYYLKKDADHRTYTQVISESRLYGYARMGYSYRKVAGIIGISPSTLYYAMRLNDGTNPRFRGMKDRYTEFMRLYHDAKEKKI